MVLFKVVKNSPPTHPLDDDAFEDVFFEELDSWFSSDIACCDSCYEKFLKIWPLAYSADDAEFQCNQIQLDVFFEGSRINAFYSWEQFERLVQNLDCPRCGNKLGYTIYPYNLPFDVPDDFEEKIEEISFLARETPFLLLKNEFAKDIFSVLEDLASSTVASKIESNMFRARALAGLKNFKIDQFDFANPEFVGEGRYNHAGKPVLYLGNSKETCFHELRETESAIAEISFDDELKILDLASPYESHKTSSDMLNALVFSALLSTPQDEQGYQKSAYVFSRFIADCARSVGFDAIRYPSTRVSESSLNLAILNPEFSIAKKLKLVGISVFDGKQSRKIEI